MGTGALTAVKEAFVWLTCCVVVFGAVFYADEIKTAALDARTKWADVATEQAGDDDASAAVREASISAGRSTVDDTPARDYGKVYITADRANQFYADAYMNNRPVRVLIDTGASHVSLRYEDAEKLGFFLTDKDFTYRARTANGTARIARVFIDRVRIGDITVRDVEAFVGEPGKKFVTLLGMSFLQKLRGVSISGRQLILSR